MVSAISLCFLVLGLSAASSQLLSGDVESLDTPTSDRRTFKHGKPVKLLPLVKKHKKFGGLIPHVFGKPSYTEIPIIHEAPKPLYKVHRYQGIEVKPVPDVSFSTPEPIIETHSAEPGDFVETFSSDHSYSAPVQSSGVLLYPIHEKPVFPSPVFSSPAPAPIPASFPPPPKPIISFVPAPPPSPVYSSIPITSIPPPPPAFSPVAISRPAPNLIPAFPPPVPVFTPVPAPPPPSQPIFSPFPIKLLPPLPAPSPAPIFSPAPVKIQPPILPSPAPTPVNVFSPISVKIPAPVVPSPAPIIPSISVVPSTPAPALPVSLPSTQFSVIPSPAPSLSVFPPPAPALPSIPISSNLEPEYPYPPSGTPIPSYIKDISLGDIELKDTPLPTIETPKFEDVTPSIPDDSSKNLDYGLGATKTDGFFQKIKGWKADKASAALNHFTNFKQKPIIPASISIPHSPHKLPVQIPPPQVPAYSSFQFPGSNHQLPQAPASVFFPPAQFFSPAKYENFPPNNIESPPLLNSYGVPIPHDSYSSSHASHDRLSSDASEEEPAVVPAPSQGKLETQQPSTQIRQDLQPQFKPNDHPVYVPEINKTVKEENKTSEDTQPEIDDYKTPTDSSPEINNYPNHKE